MGAMTLRLLLIRHAEAASTPAGGTDRDRPLAPYGLAQAKELGRLIAAGALPRPEVVYCSSAVRARQTWDAAAEAAGYAPVVEASDALYSAHGSALIAAIQATDAAVEVVALVGHAPEIPGLARSLVAARGVSVPGWPPATVGVAEWEGTWADFPDAGRLVWARTMEPRP